MTFRARAAVVALLLPFGLVLTDGSAAVAALPTKNTKYTAETGDVTHSVKITIKVGRNRQKAKITLKYSCGSSAPRVVLKNVSISNKGKFSAQKASERPGRLPAYYISGKFKTKHKATGTVVAFEPPCGRANDTFTAED